MGAFQSGFQMGGNIAANAERIRLAEEQLKLDRARDARAEEEFSFRRGQLQRERDQATQVDSLTRQLTQPNYDNYSLGTDAPASPGLRMRTPTAMPENVDGLDRPELAAGAAAPGLRMRPAAVADAEQAPAVPSSGLRAALDTRRAPTFNAAPTRADAEEVLARIAAVKGDTTGFRAARDAATRFREDDLFKTKIKEYTGAPEQIGSFVGFVNNNSKSVTLGLPDRRGFADMSIVTPTGDAVFAKLSRADQAKLYAAVGLMDMNPTKALEMIAGVNKDLAAAVAVDNGLTINVGGKQNEVAGKRAAAIASERTADAAVTNANSAAGLRRLQGDAITKAQANREEAASLISQYEALTPEEQAGSKGIGLIRQFNMLNVKAGGQVSLSPGSGGKKAGILNMPVEQKKNDDGTYTAFAKDGGQALYNTINGEAIPLGMDAQTYQATKKAAQENGVKLVAGEDGGRLVLKFQGADGKFYDDPQKARYAKPPEKGSAPDAAPAASTPGTRQAGLQVSNAPGNPYRVQGRGGARVDQAALNADMQEYESLKGDPRPVVQGRVKLLEQRLQAAGAIE